MTTVPPLVLASASPRRAALMRQVGLVFDVIPADIREVRLEGEKSREYAERLAHEKASIIARQIPDRWVIGADTIVTVRGEVLEKPADDGHAFEMIQSLAGQSHEVVTGVAVARSGVAADVSSVVTRVRFRDLSRSAIRAYVASGEGVDKAGAYGIQGLGAGLVERVDGCYFNVVGLPLAHLIGRLEALGALSDWPAERRTAEGGR